MHPTTKSIINKEQDYYQKPNHANMTEEKQHQHHQQQRIYVGGIDPSRGGLSVTEVWQRLEKKIVDVEKNAPINDNNGIVLSMRWKDLHCGNCFLQFTAILTTVKNNDNNTSTSAKKKKTTDLSPYDIVKSWFHNVMWKGCKLIVQVARPHFLERLQKEREQQKQETELSSNIDKTSMDETQQEQQQQQVISRYWKIRRGYVNEAVRHIDTQPCDVTSYKMFVRIYQRHKKQQEKDRIRYIELLKKGISMSIKEAQKRAYYNRSIRFRFPDDEGLNNMNTSTYNTNNSMSNDVVSMSSATNNSESDDSSESITDTQNPIHSQNSSGGKYVWSDSDDQSTTTSVDDEFDNNRDRVHDTKGQTTEGTSVKTPDTNNESKYTWSDDEDDSSSSEADDNNFRNKTINSTFNSRIHDLDEFDSAIGETHDKINTEQRFPTSINPETTLDCNNLDDEVERNLSILSQLFPEISAISTRNKEVHDGSIDEEVPPKTQPASHSITSGWDMSGQMLRFDPTLPQAANFLVHDDDMNVSNDHDDLSNNMIVDKSIPVVHDHLEKQDAAAANVNENTESLIVSEAILEDTAVGVYEQKQLEQIFKDVREGVPLTSSSGQVEGSTTAFSFGFHVDTDDTAQKVGPSTPFSFTFDALQEEHQKSEAIDISERNEDSVDNMDIDINRNTTNESEGQNNDTRFRPLAFDFPSEELLNEMVHDFYYNLNDGERIIRDVEGWRNDPTVKDRWLKERFTLTQDWKRKQKQAISKKQKRFR